MSKIKKLFVVLLLLGLAGPALAQQAVVTLPSARVTTDASSTIAVTDTFQQIWAAQASRVNCGIQNNDANNMWVFFGSGTPTKATSVVLAPGQFLNCATSGIVASSAVWITGTSPGVFYAGLDGAPIVGAPSVISTSFIDATASGTITTQNLVPAGTATAGSAVEIATEGVGTVTIQVTGTYTGALSPQVTTNGSVWVTQTGAVLQNMATGASSATITSGSTGIWQIEVNGHSKFRITGLAAMTGTATISLVGAAGTSQVTVAGVATAGNQTNGNQQVQGNVASGVADAGNPVKMGCVFNSTRPTFANGQRGDCQLSDRGAIGTFIQGPSGLSTASVDGTLTDGSNGNGTLRVGAFPYDFNGTNWDRTFTCTQSAVINVTAGATTQLVALSGSTVIRVCSYNVTASLAGTFTFVYGTGANCGTGTTALTGAMAIATAGANGMSGMNGSLFRGAAANALCLTAATGNMTGFVTYAQY